MSALQTPAVPRETLLQQLREAVGTAHVLTDDQATRRFRKGHRTGEGPVLAVVRPATLLEQWEVVQAAVAAGRIVMLQAANSWVKVGYSHDVAV
jgi:D-lactate dehydrogenase